MLCCQHRKSFISATIASFFLFDARSELYQRLTGAGKRYPVDVSRNEQHETKLIYWVIKQPALLYCTCTCPEPQKPLLLSTMFKSMLRSLLAHTASILSAIFTLSEIS